jgi:hypothetical protein
VLLLLAAKLWTAPSLYPLRYILKSTLRQGAFCKDNPGMGRAFSALAPEIARSDKRTRALASEQIRNDIQLIAALLPGKDKRTARSRAILTFSALVGAMSLARAVSDEALSREILKDRGRSFEEFRFETPGDQKSVRICAKSSSDTDAPL